MSEFLSILQEVNLTSGMEECDICFLKMPSSVSFVEYDIAL